jgi:hypothetical protein
MQTPLRSSPAQAKTKGASMSAKYRRELASRHYQVFLVGLAVMLAHLFEDALVHKENGSSLGAQAGSAGLALLLAAVGAALYPLLWRSVRPLLVFVYGVLALLGGWQAHVSDALDDRASGGDYSGIVYALAGLVLIGLAVKLAVDSLRPRPLAELENEAAE